MELPTENAAGQMSFSNVESRDLYAPCGPSAPIQAQVMQCAVSGVSPRTALSQLIHLID
jgi:hypothetical protein